MLDATDSTDPNEPAAIGNRSLSFEWYCEVVLEKERAPCLDNPLDAIEHFGGVWKIPARILRVDVNYRFRVIARNKKQGREKEVEQRVVLLDADIPVIDIK